MANLRSAAPRPLAIATRGCYIPNADFAPNLCVIHISASTGGMSTAPCANRVPMVGTSGWSWAIGCVGAVMGLTTTVTLVSLTTYGGSSIGAPTPTPRITKIRIRFSVRLNTVSEAIASRDKRLHLIS